MQATAACFDMCRLGGGHSHMVCLTVDCWLALWAHSRCASTGSGCGSSAWRLLALAWCLCMRAAAMMWLFGPGASCLRVTWLRGKAAGTQACCVCLLCFPYILRPCPACICAAGAHAPAPLPPPTTRTSSATTATPRSGRDHYHQTRQGVAAPASEDGSSRDHYYD